MGTPRRGYQMIMGKLVYEVARLVSETATDKVAECVEETDNSPIRDEKPTTNASAVTGGLMLALVANEVQRGTSKEDLIKFMSTVYDIVNDPKMRN
jgi:hypothetical protein